MSAKLLVVDDEEGIRANLKRHFVRRGMEVLTAECGTSAIAICGASMMDVVLLDLRLPDVGGLEVLERVKASSPQTSVVVITAHGDVDTAVKAMQLKADHTIIIVTHNLGQAARVSDYTGFMYLGEMVEFGKTDEIFIKPQDKRTEDYITGRMG